MADLDSKSRKLAKRLATLTAAAGENGPAEAKVALDHFIGDRSLSERRAFIKAYLTYFERALRETQLVVEHAGPLAEEAVRQVADAFAARAGRSFTTVTRENAGLIGGLRLIQGDNVYDASIAGRLARLASSAH